MKWFVMSFLVILASGCGLTEYEYEYEYGYRHHPKAYVHPSRDYHGNRYNRNGSQHVEVPATPGHRRQLPHPESSNQHGHDDSNQHGHDSVPGYSDATPPVQETTIHNHQ